MSISYSIKMLMDIQDPNITFEEDCVYEGTKKGHACRYVKGLLTYVPAHCDACGVINENYTIIKHGTKTSTITLPINGVKKSYLKLKKQRFYCRACQCTFSAKTPLVDEGCFISKGTQAQAIIKSAEASSKDIAPDCGVSSSTVQRVINRESKLYTGMHQTLPKNLSFDEFKYAKGQMAFTYIDAESGDIIDILPQRDGRTIRDHFVTNYSLKQRKQVKTITIDRNAGYVSLIKELFPNARIIIDRFHLVQLITRSMNKVRVQVMNTFHTSKGEDLKKYRRLKRYWKLLLKWEKDLSNTEYKYYHLFGQCLDTTVVTELLGYSSELKAHYDLYQKLLTVFKSKDHDQLEKILQEPTNPVIFNMMRTSLKTLRKHAPYIKNSFLYPFSDSRIEGINNKIKVLNRVVYGYRNFYHYKHRILLHFKFKAVEQKQQKKTHAPAA